MVKVIQVTLIQDLGDMIRLSDGTFSVDLQDEDYPTRSVFSINYYQDDIQFVGYPELDSMFYDVVTCNSDNFDYVSTVTE